MTLKISREVYGFGLVFGGEERESFCSAILAPVDKEYWFWWEEKGEV